MGESCAIMVHFSAGTVVRASNDSGDHVCLRLTANMTSAELWALIEERWPWFREDPFGDTFQRWLTKVTIVELP